MKTYKIKKLAAVMLAASLSLSLAACGKSDNAPTGEKEKITLVLDWTPNTNHTGIYAAKELGYFDKAGLAVEIIQPPEDSAQALTASGKAQFGVAFQDTLAPALVGENALPVTAVAALIQHNTSGIVSLKGKGIASPKGMSGKKYATWDSPVEKAIIKNIVRADGGDYDKIEMIPDMATDEVSALKSGRIDAVWIFEAWAGVKMRLEGLETDYFAVRDINPVFDYYTPVIIANNQFLSERPEATKKFLAALRDGYEYAINNPEKAADILLKASPELDKSLAYESQKYLSARYKAEVTRWGYIDPARWNAFYNWLNENNLLENKLPENAGFSNEYLPEQN